MSRVTDNITIEGADIGFRNFSGKISQFNPMGHKNFCVFFDDIELAELLEKQGWNIKYLKPRDEGDEPRAYLPVRVNYAKWPPKVVLRTSRGQTFLDDNTIEMLDWAEFKNLDLTIRPSNWDVNGKFGVKAYLKSMYVTIIEDELDLKYAAIDEPNTSRDNPWSDEE